MGFISRLLALWGLIPLLGVLLIGTTADAANPRVFISPTGDDTNSGESASPLLTLNAAARALGGIGTIRVLPGDYFMNPLDASLVSNVTVVGQQRPRFFYGQQLTNFVDEGGGLYSATVDTNRFRPTPDKPFIFEWGTAEGFIPLSERTRGHQNRSWRLPEFCRLIVSRSLVALTNGSWLLTNSTLYFRWSDGGVPGGRSVWLPSSLVPDAFCYNSRPNTNLKVWGINAYFGWNNFDCTGMQYFQAMDCGTFGAQDEGIWNGDMSGNVDLIRVESAANNNDNAGYWAGGVLTGKIASEKQCWFHDSGDEASSGHAGAMTVAVGGCYEYALSGGLTPWAGASVIATNCDIRRNYIGLYPCGSPTRGNPAWTNSMTSLRAVRCRIYDNAIGIHTDPLEKNIDLELIGCSFNNNVQNLGWDAAFKFVDFVNCRIGSKTPLLVVAPTSIPAGGLTNVAFSSMFTASGTATLSSGTCVVYTSVVNQDSQAFLTVPSPGSGTLSWGDVTNNVSFTIHSSSASDDATVRWMVYQP